MLQRVFELGWTTERFGKFDRTWDFDGIGQFSTKESIGRKYQWIAYHEVLRLISDHLSMATENCTLLTIENQTLQTCGRTPDAVLGCLARCSCG